MVNAPNISLKVVIIVHFVLSVWASMALPPAYAYMNAFILAFGFWAIVDSDSLESVFMFMILNLIAVVMDIIFLSAFRPALPTSGPDAFALAMGIINLLLRAPASFVLYRLYQDRGGQYSDMSIPGMPNFGGGGASNHGHGYENIDHPISSNTIETASPHHSIDGKSPIP